MLCAVITSHSLMCAGLIAALNVRPHLARALGVGQSPSAPAQQRLL